MATLTMGDGAVINYRVDDLTPQWLGEPETILMIPRHSENLHFLTPLAAHLAPRFRIVRMDARGRGESTWPPNSPTLSGGPDESTLFQRQAKDALALMEHLGIEKYHGLGSGGGGATCMICALMHPERIKSLTVIGMSCKLPDDLVATWRDGEKDIATAVRKYGASGWVDRALFPKIIDKKNSDPRFTAWNRAQRDSVSAETFIAVFTGASMLDLCGEVGKIKTPTLLITEEKNEAIHLEQVRDMQKSMPNARLIVYEGMALGAHTVTADRCAANVMKFIEGIK